jgi:hypothetical protein
VGVWTNISWFEEGHCFEGIKLIIMTMGGE